MEDAAPPARRSLPMVVARQLARVRPRGALLRSVFRSLVVALLAALAGLPLAVIWGITHASTTEYLGPHRVVLSSNFSSEVRIDLGPIGNAYLDSPASPIGLDLVVGGVGSATGVLNVNDLLSARTLAAYTALYADPQEVANALIGRLVYDGLGDALTAELILLAGFGLWQLRGRLLVPWAARRLTRRRLLVVYLAVVALLVGSILVPAEPEGTRIDVEAAGTRFGPVQVDNVLFADLLDRAFDGVRLLVQRQSKAVDDYVATAMAGLDEQSAKLAGPAPGETVLMSFSDLHCNQATTRLIGELVARTQPSLIISSGDDTVNGTAAERSCIRREARIGGGTIPIVVSTGNHDSDLTEAQMRAFGMNVLDGSAVTEAGITVLGDDDPEQNLPFSVERRTDRPETEEQMGQRMIDIARNRRVDVITLHQPAATAIIRETPNPPARLILYGHMHTQVGPQVIAHDDGSWSVAIQQGTAGGVRQPTITSFSTPFSTPLLSADVYRYFRDDATGLITGVQPVHFLPDGSVAVDDRIVIGDPAFLPLETRIKLGVSPSPTPAETSAVTPTPSPSPTG